MDAANAKRKQTLGVQVVEPALRPAHGLPQRTFAKAAAFADSCQHEETLSFDGVEHRSHRPGGNAAQQDQYSGKKSATPSQR